MDASLPFPYQKVIAYFLLGLLMLGASLVESAHCLATIPVDKAPHFSIEPIFPSSYNTAPRSYFTYNGYPSTQLIDSIHVTNAGTVRGTASLHAVDAITAQTSGMTVRESNVAQQDVGVWTSLSSQEVTLDPGQSMNVPFKLTIPNHVRPGQHGGAIVAEYKSQETRLERRHTIKVQIRSILVLGMLITIPGPTFEKLNATGVQYDEQSKHQRVLMTLENTGTQILHPAGKLQVTDSQGHLLQNIPLQLSAFLPQNTIDYPIYMLHKALLPNQNYTARLDLTYEGHHTLHYIGSFSVPSLDKAPIVNKLTDLVTTPTTNTNISSFWYYVAGIGILLFALVFFMIIRSRKHS